MPDSSWIPIAIVAVAVGVPAFVFGYIRGYRNGTEDSDGRNVLQDSVRDAVKHSRDVPED